MIHYWWSKNSFEAIKFFFKHTVTGAGTNIQQQNYFLKHVPRVTIHPVYMKIGTFCINKFFFVYFMTPKCKTVKTKLNVGATACLLTMSDAVRYYQRPEIPRKDLCKSPMTNGNYVICFHPNGIVYSKRTFEPVDSWVWTNITVIWFILLLSYPKKLPFS